MAKQRESLAFRFLKGALSTVLLVGALPLILPFVAIIVIHRVFLHALICFFWLPRGKDVLLVSSDSPIWHEYMQSQIFPLVEKRATALNWSERKKWRRWSLASQAFYSVGGYRNFNPLVVVFRPLRPARVFRFWAPFKEWKHGNTQPVERLRGDLIQALATAKN